MADHCSHAVLGIVDVSATATYFGVQGATICYIMDTVFHFRLWIITDFVSRFDLSQERLSSTFAAKAGMWGSHLGSRFLAY